MDKNAIKKYAVWARRELISRVSQRAALYEITADGYGDQNSSSVHGRLISAEEKKQRIALITQIKEKGYEQVMEEIAYTWFNRFSALRFMEVNGYLPTRVRVFTDDENNFKPQILSEAINMELDGLDMRKVYDFKNANDDDALFKYMIIVQCNALSKILPGMFQRISDYTELLFPDNLLREGSVVEQMIAIIPQEDWTDQVQIIGWLYQYYNSEPKNQVFANLKKNIKITKENIPAATQLFTPDWIVRYMVENSLGRLWLEGHPNNDLKAEWKYYLDEAEQEPEVKAQLAEIRKEYAALKPEDILAIDPCQGSGHILAYMFDVLVQIYEAYGYSAREAASSIVERNIWGLDIDERATQLAYFSVMMKARQYDRRFFSRGIQPHVYAIQESNNFDPHCIEYFVNGRKDLKSAMDTLVRELRDAKEYGSILNVSRVDFNSLYERFDEIRNEAAPGLYNYQALDSILPFVQVAQAMAQKYHVVVTNPPYMGASNMNSNLVKLLKDQFSDYKSDFFSAFIIRGSQMAKKEGFCGFFSPYVWMFIQSYEKLRKYLYSNCTIETLIQFEYSAFEEATVPVCTLAFRNKHVCGKKGCYLRLTDFRGGMEVQRIKTVDAIANHNCGYYYEKSTDVFSNIPSAPVAYWLKDAVLSYFKEYPSLGDLVDFCKGLVTLDNNRFLRLWQEVCWEKVSVTSKDAEEAKTSHCKWFSYNKGGDFRRWYGNRNYLINWENDGEELKENVIKSYGGGSYTKEVRNEIRYFKSGLTWTTLSSGLLSFRYSPAGSIFDSKGSMAFTRNADEEAIVLAYLNSCVAQYFLKFLSPTIDYNIKGLSNLPLVIAQKETILSLCRENVNISKEDWDSYETSWDFKEHPFITSALLAARSGEKTTIKQSFEDWKGVAEGRFHKLKENEEKLNHIFISIYGLNDELTPNVENKDITVHKADLRRDVRDFVSYAVGCMFGRYSYGRPGLIYAGGEWDDSKYTRFKPDKDGIIPICDDEYFEDDIVGCFVKFLEKIYGEETLEENLRFIADALGGKGSSREVIRNYFINDFYADHCSNYSVTGSGKRPIYWLFDSGKKNGFKCLIYMHRYQPDTIARIRTDYVHEQQSRYRTAIADLESRVATAATSERVKLTKRLDSIKAQAEELRVYEEKIHHLADQMIKIDLDDGVKVNYAKLQDVLAKIK